ncbi:MarR family transcriptional regulator [Streptomyces sp. NPDC026672]|uniref:MarR family winged helix-turn-helix transcriptional regulator n=1 Tax=unclassified Streptomyces TaxID=2593676 RepID=UPI0033CFF2E5
MRQQQAAELAAAMQAGCLGSRVGRLHRMVARRFDQALRPTGVSLPQLEVLGILLRDGPLKPSAVAERLAVERSTISRNLALMERHGWIALDISPSGRVTSAATTDRGVAALASAAGAWATAQRELTEVIGVDVAPAVDDWLGTLADSPD